MGGPGSGNRSHYDHLAVEELVGLSVSTVLKYLQDSSASLEKRVEVASRFALKHIPDKLMMRAQVSTSHALTDTDRQAVINSIITLVRPQEGQGRQEGALTIPKHSDDDPSSGPSKPDANTDVYTEPKGKQDGEKVDRGGHPSSKRD